MKTICTTLLSVLLLVFGSTAYAAQPEQENYGAYLVHYSGWEDPWGMLTDSQLKTRFDNTFPTLADVIRVAERGQQWVFR